MTRGASFDRAALTELKARHLAFLSRRLTGDEARDGWRASVSAGIEAVLDAPLAEVLPPDAIADALERLATARAFDALARPIAVALRRVALAELGAEKGKLGDRVPPPARAALDRLLGRPGLAPERLIREVCENDAAQEVMREVLGDALRGFQDNVNPFSAEWGLPSLLKKLSPFGLGVGKGLEGLRAEFERRLEPEMRKFLQGASRHALARTAEMMVSKWDEPSFVGLRRELLRWMLAQPARDVARGMPEEALADGHAAALEISRAWLLDPDARARFRSLARGIAALRGTLSLRDALRELGAEPAVDAGALADLTWPAVRAALRSAAATAWLTSLVADFYDQELQAAPPSKPAAG